MGVPTVRNPWFSGPNAITPNGSIRRPARTDAKAPVRSISGSSEVPSARLGTGESGASMPRSRAAATTQSLSASAASQTARDWRYTAEAIARRRSISVLIRSVGR